jgi:hypothetical protein
MTKSRMLALLVVVAHWVDAIGHLFLAAKILPAPNDHVSWLAVVLITAGHLVVSIAVWKLGDRIAGLTSLIFFLAAMSADLYEHFLHASGNNVFMVEFGYWAAWFDASVVVLLALEILGCSIGIWLLGARTRGRNSAPGVSSDLIRPKLRLSASLS